MAVKAKRNSISPTQKMKPNPKCKKSTLEKQQKLK